MLEKVKDSANEETSYEYDSLNRLTSVKDGLGTITYTYDANGNITDVKETKNLLENLVNTGSTIHREFDKLNRITSYTDYQGRTVKYGYDNLGNLKTLTYPGGEIVTYTYNGDGSIATMTSNSGGTIYTWQYAYDRYGRLETITRPDGTVETRFYDEAGNLEHQEDVNKDGTKVQENDYTYNVFGEVIEKKTLQDGDLSTLEVVKMTYDDANRLESYNGQEVIYDAKGNMVKGPVDGVIQKLEYDCRNRLISAGGVTYTYDAENTRIATTENGKTTEYVTDTGGSLSKLLTAYEADGSTTTYFYGVEGLSGQYNNKAKEGLFYHFDNIGSTTAITNALGIAVYNFAYGTYGELLSTVEKSIRFLYNGAYGVTTDSNGLYYMRARYYNPDIKRFINQDIKVGDIGNSQSLNRYAYCEGNPVSLIDPFGLSPEPSQEQGEKSKYEWLHTILDVAGLVIDAADVVNGLIYAAEGNWVQAGISMACALPVVGSFVTGVTKATKYAKVGKLIGKTLSVAGKMYMTAAAGTAALDLAGDAKLERAANGGKSTPGSVMKSFGAMAMAGIAALSGGSLIDEVHGLSKAVSTTFNTRSQEAADAMSGRCAKGSGIGCFIAGTKVKAIDGERNIEDIEVGDYVLAEDEETGKQGYKKVTRTFIYEKTTIVHVYVGDEEIETTREHPFYVEGIGFVSAGELRVGDIIRTSAGKNLPIKKIEIEDLEEPTFVYNFEVEDYHTYYVSELGVLVHNECPKTTTSVKDGKVVSEGGTSTGKYQVGAYQDIKGVEGLDAHHVGQKAVMKKLVNNYDPKTAPAINVPKVGHTISGPNGIVSRNTKGINNARQLLARDLFELKRVYPDIPNSSYRELIDMNMKMYPEMRKK